MGLKKIMESVVPMCVAMSGGLLVAAEPGRCLILFEALLLGARTPCSIGCCFDRLQRHAWFFPGFQNTETNIQISVCMYIYIYICVYLYVCAYRYVCVHMCLCIYVYVFICIYVCMYICIYVYMYVCIYV